MVKIYLVGKSMAVLLHTKNPIGKVLILLHTERIIPHSSSETVYTLTHWSEISKNLSEMTMKLCALCKELDSESMQQGRKTYFESCEKG